jgi:KAP family P-loop domain
VSPLGQDPQMLHFIFESAKVEHRYVTESLVISLNAGFGAGKSTFFKMWADSIKKNCSTDSPVVVEVNAWNDDYCGDPFVALVSGLIESLNQEDPKAKSLLNAAKDIGWFLTGVGNQVVNKLTGVNVVSAGELAEKKKSVREGRQDHAEGYFDIYRAKRKALQSIKDAIRDLIRNGSPSILILVDELDRCRPDYAISYLETIKHVFDIHGIVFVLAVDRKQLECSAKAAFGVDLDFPEYYRKFVQREVALPKPNEEAYKVLASRYVEYYLERESERYCFMPIDRYRVENIVELISCMKMTPRQVQEVFRVMGHVLETDESNRGRLMWCLGVGTILMSALRIGSHDIYRALGEQNLGIKEAVAFFKRLGLMHAEWWFELCWTGGGLNSEELKDKEVADIYLEAGLISKGEKPPQRTDFSQWSSGWGQRHSSNGRFAEIYLKIEQVASWN